MTTWVRPHLFDFMNTDVPTSATTLNILQTCRRCQFRDATDRKIGQASRLSGNVFRLHRRFNGRSFGAGALLGFLYLLYRKVVSWHIPFYYLGTFFILTGICWLTTSSPAVEPLTHLLSGGLLLGAFFMATDYTTSPMVRTAKIILPSAAGVLTFVIRRYAPIPKAFRLPF